MLDSSHLLFPTSFPGLKRQRLETLQVNLGYRCNQTCQHCHVDAGPNRTEVMALDTVEQVLECLQENSIAALDLTGGAPELNSHFRYLVERARDLGARVIDRCNLTILEEPGQENLAVFLAENQVEVIASLPCYLKENVDSQRGHGTYEASVRGLQRLNELGYGVSGSNLLLNIVFNPTEPSLPPPQETLEADYKQQLHDRFGIHFNNLYTLVNMPILRFGSLLQSRGEFEAYLDLLRGAFKHDNLGNLMCLSQISVDWQGYLYDCDFNQMLDLPLVADGRLRTHISDLVNRDFTGAQIEIAEHCFGCTAGQGSSCGGALT
ncbi:Radical SAM [hydrothermal vent metagenome]|uniref:Radical SAM n=1 Tax=hydrothermal vent metagenome TaxID=652676 RepID=A0A3B1BWU4_9ZZZZ